MNREDVTLVTGNSQHAEAKLVIDLIAWAGALYLMTHPDTFDKAGELMHRLWKRFVHQTSIWSAQQEIRSLPETEE